MININLIQENISDLEQGSSSSCFIASLIRACGITPQYWSMALHLEDYKRLNLDYSSVEKGERELKALERFGLTKEFILRIEQAFMSAQSVYLGIRDAFITIKIINNEITHRSRS